MKPTLFTTVNDIVSGPRLTLAMAQIGPVPFRRDIDRVIEGLRRVGTPKSSGLVGHFTGILARADNDISGGKTHYHSELKRVAMALSLVNLGDL